METEQCRRPQPPFTDQDVLNTITGILGLAPYLRKNLIYLQRHPGNTLGPFWECFKATNLYAKPHMPAPTFLSRRFKRALGVLCLTMILGMLGVALWPFNPFPRNRVSWLGNQDGLRFADPGIVFSAADFRWTLPAASAAAVPQDIGCTLEIWLKPTARG